MPGGEVIGALMHGWSGLAVAYAAVQGPMVAGMLRTRAATRQLWLSPVLAAPVTAAAGTAMALASPLFQGLASTPSALMHLVVGTALSATFGYATGRAFGRPSVSTTLHQRGARILSVPPVAVQAQAHGHAHTRAQLRTHAHATLRLAGVPINMADETKHFKFIGTTGTGKSSAICELLETALARGDRAVIADPDGGYLRRFYSKERGDLILNPFERSSRRWDLFGEIRANYDVEQLARALIPDQEGGDRSWRSYARTFFTAVTQQARAAGVRDVSELYRLLVVADARELRTLTGGTPAQPFLDEHNSRMFDSIRSVTSSSIGALEYIAAQSGSPLSVRSWVGGEGDARRGALFLPYKSSQVAALRSLVCAWMRIAIFETMEQPTAEQRLWFVVDELDALGPIDGLKDALARIRKFGGRCVLGFQSIAQVTSTYGVGEGQTIVENCGNTLILRCSASEGGGTARFASALIGQRQVSRTTCSRSQRPTDWMAATTRSEHLSIEPAVMDAEIEQLPDLVGYLKVASRPEWLSVQLSVPAAVQGLAESVLKGQGPAARDGTRGVPGARQSDTRAAAQCWYEPDMDGYGP